MASIRDLAARIVADDEVSNRNKKRVAEILRLLDSIIEEISD